MPDNALPQAEGAVPAQPSLKSADGLKLFVGTRLYKIIGALAPVNGEAAGAASSGPSSGGSVDESQPGSGLAGQPMCVPDVGGHRDPRPDGEERQAWLRAVPRSPVKSWARSATLG